MKKFISIVLAAAVLAVSAAFTGIPCARAAVNDVTILVYICGADLESDEGEASADIREMISAGIGGSGAVSAVIATGGWPILIAHWQSLFSNGLGTGLRVLAETARRIETHLAGRVQWMSSEEIMRLVLEDPGRYPMPDFS